MKLRINVLLVFCFVSMLVSALEFNYQGLTYHVDDENHNECAVTGIVQGMILENLNIPETAKHGEMEYTVTSIEGYAFEGVETLKNVTIPNSILTIRGYAFAHCRNLETVSMGESVKEIGILAFDSCEKLEEIVIPESVETIGYKAFSSSGVKTVYFNATHCQALDSRYESFPSTLDTVIFGENVEIVPDNAFIFCQNLSDVSLSSSIQSIGDCAFYCSGLVTMSIPESVKTIGDRAFEYCSQLKSISIPNSVTEIGVAAFSACSALELLPLLNSVSKISNSMFRWCGFETVEIPNTIKEIGSYAFSGCAKLKNVVVPNSVERISDDVFYCCSELESVVLPHSVNELGGGVFGNCQKLVNVQLPENLTVLPAYTFNGCSSLETVELPSEITRIEEGAFKNCESLESICFPKKLECIENEAFWGCISLKELDFPSSLRILGDYAFSTGIFSEYPNLTIQTVKFNGPIQSIGYNTFCNCALIENVDIWDVDSWATVNMSLWESNPIYYSGKFTVKSQPVSHILISEDVERVMPYTFISSWNLLTVRVESSIIGKSSFENTTIRELCINATEIESNAFYACGSLRNIYSLTPLPPKGEDNVFMTFNEFSSEVLEVYENAILYVPIGCAEDYRNSQYCWRLFSNIVETDFAGLEEKFAPDHDTDALPSVVVSTVGGIGEEKIFKLNGVEVTSDIDALAPGVYISVKGTERKKIVVGPPM